MGILENFWIRKAVLYPNDPRLKIFSSFHVWVDIYQKSNMNFTDIESINETLIDESEFTWEDLSGGIEPSGSGQGEVAIDANWETATAKEACSLARLIEANLKAKGYTVYFNQKPPGEVWKAGMASVGVYPLYQGDENIHPEFQEELDQDDHIQCE